MLAPGGRLLAVDFAPHGLEFLRETQAHRRLGFAHEQMRAWFAEAGIDTEVARDLSPPGKGEKLTVTLWLGRDRRAAIPSTETALRREVA